MEHVSCGGCACGAVRYQVAGVPSNSMVCHCQSCRRISAAPVVAWLTFDKSRFAFSKGAPSVYCSSEKVQRTFCALCGTPLTYQHADDAAGIDVTTCSMDEPDRFPPTHHSWLSHDIAWLRFGDGLPGYPQWKK